MDSPIVKMELYAPGEVYNCIVDMMARRGVTLDSTPLTLDQVAQRLNHYEFITITGVRGSEDVRGAATVMTILIAPNSKYSNKTGDFKKLLKGLPKVRADEKLEVIFVSAVPLTVHIDKQIKAYREELGSSIQLENHTYNLFIIDPTKHVSVPVHQILTEDEIESLCRRHCTVRDRFPKILQSDPQAVWLGLKPGMMVKIMSRSETAGKAVRYRYCMR